MSTSAPKKPSKEMRVSDWLRVKNTASQKSSTPLKEPSRDIPLASLAPTANTVVTPPNNHHSAGTAPTSAPVDAQIRPTRIVPHSAMRPLGSVPQQAPRSTVPEASPVAVLPPPESVPVEPLPFDFFRLVGGVLERRAMIVFWSLVALACGFFAGFLRGDTYEGSSLLMIRDVPTTVPFEAGVAYRPKEFDKGTLWAILTSEALLKRVAPKVNPPMTTKLLKQYITIEQTRGDGFVELRFRGASSEENAVHNVNTWSQEAVNFTKVLQSRETVGTRVYLQRQSLEENINRAKAELTALRSQYSDQNPLVREKLAQIDWLQEQLDNLDNGKSPLDVPPTEEKVESSKDMVGYFSIMSPATTEAVKEKSRWFKGAVLGGIGLLGAFVLGCGLALSKEMVSRLVRTPRELELAIRGANIQKIPALNELDLDSTTELSGLWSRIVGASPRELVCFWTPDPHEQPHLVIQGLLNLASRRDFPIIWVETEGETAEPPGDFQAIELSALTQSLEPGRYRLKLDLRALTAAEAENTASMFVHVAARHRMPVWLSLQGSVAEPGTSLASQAHRVKILATLGTANREYWETQRDLLKQSVKTPIEWLAVNFVPWYRW